MSTNAVQAYLDNNCTWDDQSMQAFGQTVDTSQGRIDYDYDELTLDFAANARYDQEAIGVPLQTLHSWAEGTVLRPHFHWLQEEDEHPNILLAWRAYNNGDAVPATWTLVPNGSPIFTYASGTILQITNFAELDLPTLGLSACVDMKLFRDSGNESGEFAGDDPYTGAFKLKFFDVHYPEDSRGSETEYIKNLGGR